MASGKQVLLTTIKNLSTKMIDSSDLQIASERMRSALLCFGSTSADSLESVERLIWAEERQENAVLRQGIATKDSKIFIEDILQEILDDELLEQLCEKFKDSTKEELSSCLDAIAWIIFSTTMYPCHLEFEDDESDIEMRLESMTKNRAMEREYRKKGIL